METWTDLNGKRLSNLDNFDTVFIGGGNTWLLLKEIRESGFDKLLVEFLALRGSIYGGSAGAIILGKKIVTHDDDEVGWKDEAGLDLLNEYSVACHYKPEEEDKYQKWAKDNNLPLICLPEEAGAVIGGHEINFIGDKPCLKIT
jgi:dipeptidase E